MKYSCFETIDLPRETVIQLFDNTDNLAKWQEGLESFVHKSGDFGQPGSKYDIVIVQGKRRIEMVETIVERALPDRFAATYEAKGVWNLVENAFVDRGESTEWRLDTEFKCTGFIRLMTWVAPGLFRKQTAKMMANFKRFAEGEAAKG